MKPLLALSLLLNLCLLTALGYLLVRGPEVVTETKEVVVTKTLNPNIELETRVIALEAELEQEKARHVEDVQAYAAELAQAEATVETMKEGLLPPLVIPEGPRALGKYKGKVNRKMMLALIKLKKIPEYGTPEYKEYDLIRRKAFQDVAPILMELEEMDHMAHGTAAGKEYVAAAMGTSLALDKIQQSQLDAYFIAAQAEITKSHEAVKNQGNEGVKQFFADRKAIEEKYFEAIRQILTPEQRQLFDRFYRVENYMYSTGLH